MHCSHQPEGRCEKCKQADPCPTDGRVWLIGWTNKARVKRIDAIALNDEKALVRKLIHATSMAEGHVVTVTQYWP